LDQVSERLKAAQGELQKLRADYAALEAKHADATKAAEQHGASVAELTGLNEKLSSEKSALERQLAQARQASDTARSQLGDLKTRAAEADKLAQEQMGTIGDLKTANEKLQADAAQLTNQISTLRAENAKLGSAGEALGSLRNEIVDLKTRLAEAQKAVEQHASTVAELTGVNEKLTADTKNLEQQLAALRAENGRLAEGEAARQEAEQRAASFATAAAQLTATQRELGSARAEIARLNDAMQVLERDRGARIAQLQQENAAIAARLRQAQGTLDQIASAARLINGGAGHPSGASVSNPSAPTAVAAAPITPAPRVHVVAEGDSLTRISVRYYGTSNRWQEIYDANREILKGENALRPGQRLRIP
jgi:nucleoid-associated protein YgaU